MSLLTVRRPSYSPGATALVSFSRGAVHGRSPSAFSPLYIPRDPEEKLATLMSIAWLKEGRFAGKSGYSNSEPRDLLFPSDDHSHPYCTSIPLFTLMFLNVHLHLEFELVDLTTPDPRRYIGLKPASLLLRHPVDIRNCPLIIKTLMGVRSVILAVLLDEEIIEKTRRLARSDGSRRRVVRILLIMEDELHLAVNVA